MTGTRHNVASKVVGVHFEWFWMLEESSFSIIDFSGALARLTGGESGEPYGLLLRVALRCAWGAVGAVIAAFLLHKKMKPKDFFFSCHLQF